MYTYLKGKDLHRNLKRNQSMSSVHTGVGRMSVYTVYVDPRAPCVNIAQSVKVL